MPSADDHPFRVLPRVDDLNEFFWTSGADGKLRFLRCDTDGYYIHPPAPICPKCLGKGLTATEVSGRATLHSFTVNHQPWIPGFDPPYVIGLIEIEEQPDVRLMTNVIGCEPDDVRIGMPLEVTFQEYDDVFLPLFRPAGAGADVDG